VPEGDTVHRARLQLDRVLLGRELTRAELRVPALAGTDLRGRVVESQHTHGKHLFTRLSGDAVLHTHLKMTGTWRVQRRPPPPGSRATGDDHIRVVLVTAAGAVVGERVPVVELLTPHGERAVTGRLGPDLLHPDFDVDEASARLAAAPDRPISDALLDQTNLAGLGNFWVNELCYLRGVHPAAPTASVEVPPLVRLAVRALRQSAFTGPYQVTTGDTRTGRRCFVYGRAGDCCLRCGSTILDDPATPLTRKDVERRHRWWCPRCQPWTS
jgi:endonuclease VIII